MVPPLTNLLLITGLGLSLSSASASIIIDSSVENTNGWTASGGFVSGLGTLSPQESTELARVPHSFFGATIQSPALGGTVAAGTYNIQFAIGNDNSTGLSSFGLDFAGLTPNSENTPSPPAGSWELWTAEYIVPFGDSNIGNPHQFTATIFSNFGGRGAFDGAGSLSTDGNGFLVDFAPAAVPEASEAIVVLLGMTGLVFGARRRRRG